MDLTKFPIAKIYAPQQFINGEKGNCTLPAGISVNKYANTFNNSFTADAKSDFQYTFESNGHLII